MQPITPGRNPDKTASGHAVQAPSQEDSPGRWGVWYAPSGLVVRAVTVARRGPLRDEWRPRSDGRGLCLPSNGNRRVGGPAASAPWAGTLRPQWTRVGRRRVTQGTATAAAGGGADAPEHAGPRPTRVGHHQRKRRGHEAAGRETGQHVRERRHSRPRVGRQSTPIRLVLLTRLQKICVVTPIDSMSHPCERSQASAFLGARGRPAHLVAQGDIETHATNFNNRRSRPPRRRHDGDSRPAAGRFGQRRSPGGCTRTRRGERGAVGRGLAHRT